FFSSRRRHTRSDRDWSSDVCSSDLTTSSRAERKQEQDEVRRHLEEFVRSRVGVEAFVEPRTTVTPPTVLLVASSGEWTRRRVPRSEERRVGKAGRPLGQQLERRKVT